MPKNKYSLIVFYLTYSIPLVLFFDWLLKLELTSLPLGVLFKGLTIVFNIDLLLRKGRRIGKFKFGKIILYFLFLNIIYSFLSEDPLQSLYLTVRIMYWVSTSFSIFYLLKYNIFSLKRLKFVFISTALIGSFFTMYLMSISEEHQNASAYLLLWCFPILLMFRQTIFVRLVEILSIVSIILTIKRGAIIALLVFILFYILGYVYVETNFKRKSRIVITGIVFFLTSSFIIFLNQDRFTERFEDTTGSGRDIVYTALIDKYLSSDIGNLVFGYGVNGVERYIGYFLSGRSEKMGPAAHSDLLQYMFDFGLLGVLFILMLHFFIIGLLRVHFKYKTRIFPIILGYYFVFFLTTIYSFILNVPDAIFFGIGACIFSIKTDQIKAGFSVNEYI